MRPVDKRYKCLLMDLGKDTPVEEIICSSVDGQSEVPRAEEYGSLGTRELVGPLRHVGICT